VGGIMDLISRYLLRMSGWWLLSRWPLRPTECYICTSEPRLLAGSILGNGSSEVYRWLLYSVLESRWIYSYLHIVVIFKETIRWLPNRRTSPFNPPPLWSISHYGISIGISSGRLRGSDCCWLSRGGSRGLWGNVNVDRAIQRWKNLKSQTYTDKEWAKVYNGKNK
jgi:hypothetical protein